MAMSATSASPDSGSSTVQGHGRVNGRPRQRGGRGRSSRRPNGTFELKEECDLADASHRSAGVWAIDSVNANAWPRAHEVLESSASDMALIQETKRRGKPRQAAERQAAASRWSVSLADANLTEAGKCSAGVAAGARAHIGMTRDTDFIGDGILAGRYMRRWCGAVCRGGIHVGPVYLRSAEGPSQENLDILEEIAADLAQVRGPWVLAGDFNLTPAQLVATGWLELVRGVLIAPKRNTCNDKTLDYFIVSEALAPAVVGASLIRDAYCGPHYGVRLFLNGAPRAMKVRRLRKPTLIGPSLPHGCLGRDAAEAARRETDVHGARTDYADETAGTMGAMDGGSDDKWRTWISDAEHDLMDLMGDTGGNRTGASTRSCGPTFKWECALGGTASPHRGSTATAREWRCVVAWAKAAATAATFHASGQQIPHGVHRAAAAACTRAAALTRRVMTGDGADAPRMAAWLIGAHAADPAALGVLSAMSEAHAVALEQAATNKRKQDWVQWLRKGHSNGLSNQHRFTRTSGGWISSKVAARPGTTFGDLDDADGITADERARIATADLGDIAPLSTQDTVEQEAIE